MFKIKKIGNFLCFEEYFYININQLKDIYIGEVEQKEDSDNQYSIKIIVSWAHYQKTFLSAGDSNIKNEIKKHLDNELNK